MWCGSIFARFFALLQDVIIELNNSAILFASHGIKK